MQVNREKESLVHTLHPVTSLVYISVVVVLALVFSHPLYMGALLAALVALIITSGHLADWKKYLVLIAGMTVMIMLVNSLMVKAGSTVLLTGPRVPVLGRIEVSLEAVCFGAVMGLRLMIIISAFCLYNYAVHPDKVLKLFSRFGRKSVLVVTMATRLFPLMARDARRVAEVQRCRGVKLDTGSKWQRVKNRLPVVNIVLMSSLERSMQMAESMQARGYGSGGRSCYTRELWRPRDYIVIAATAAAFFTGVFSFVYGWSGFTYYPRLEEINAGDLKAVPVIAAMMAVPAVLNWGWNKWHLLKSRI